MESVLVARSKTTLEAGVRLNIVATARLVIKEMWTLSEMKLIQRTILSGKIEMQYTTEYLEDTRRISISLRQVDDQVFHIRKHHQGLAFYRFKLGIGTQFRFLKSKFPPGVLIELEVATTPNIEGYTCEERDPQCEPEPKILAPKTPLEIICAYPAPILIRGMGKN